MIFYFGFDFFFFIDRLAIKLFFYIRADIIYIVLYFSDKSSSSMEKNTHLVCPSNFLHMHSLLEALYVMA